MHFVVENICAKNTNDFKKIEEIYLIKLESFKKKIFKIGNLKNFITPNHIKTKRNYLKRMMDKKIICMNVSKKYGFDYWDGDRKFGYGGYTYKKNYHTPLAKKLIKEYKLNNNSRILDIGCGKGFLLYEIKRILRDINIIGLDISKYAKKNSKKEISKDIFIHDANKKFKFNDKSFDLVISINTLHNLKINKLKNCLEEIERLGKSKFICVESYKNNKEQFNLQCWALTAETLIDVESWIWLFKISKYSGDYEFIFFK